MLAAIRQTAAAAGALLAYLTTVLPRARRELRRLQPLPETKLRNAEAVAVFATLAPRRSRATVVRAIVALQVAIDLRDVFEETGEEVGADGRIGQLEARWQRDLSALPAADTVRPCLQRAVERCEQGQRHTHRAAQEGEEPLRQWGERLPAASGYRWWEVAAGASSSAAAHALIAAAGDRATNTADAAAVDAAYHPSIGALTVFLDDLVDLDADCEAGEHSYLSYYASSAEAADRLAWIADQANARIDALPRAGRHRAILAGVGAFYLSDAGTRTGYAEPIRSRLLAALGPGTRVLAAFVRRTARFRPGST